MEVALQQAPTLVVVDDEARLAHALRLARGFALFFVRCNIPLYRAEVVARLKEGLPRPVVEVDLTKEPEVYPAIARAAESSPEESALFIYGLEAHLPSADRERTLQTLRGLNWRRAAYQRLARPLFFWLPEYALNLLAQEAPDFYDWNSGVFELVVPELFRETLLAALAVPETGDFLALRAEEKESQIRLLEGLWEEYGEAHPIEQQARLWLALQLGDLNRSLGRYEEAWRWLMEAQRLARVLGDQGELAQTLHRLGALVQAQGDYTEAGRLYEQAAFLGPRGSGKSWPLREQAAVFHQLGVLAQAQGDYAKARRLYGQVAKAFQKLQALREQAAVLHQLGTLAQDQGDWAEARCFYEESLRIRKKLGDRAGAAQTLYQLGILARDQGDWAEAYRCYEESLRIAKELNDQAELAVTLHQLGILALGLGDLEGAMRLYRESLAIYEALGDLRGKAATLAMMGQVLLAQGHALEGIRALRQALEILDRIGARADAERVARILAEAQRMMEVDTGAVHK